MKVWTIICVLLTITACHQIKDLSEKKDTYFSAHTSQEINHVEKKDTTFDYHPTPERSQNNYTADSSYVETSLAWSVAKWSSGILSHTIENKSIVPIRAPSMIQIRTLIIRDTVEEYLSLTEEHTVVKEKFRFLNAFLYYSGSVAWLILIAITTWKIYKQCKILKM